MDISNFRPQKSFGQNFLKDLNIVQKIVKRAKLKPSDVVLEVGPGLGVLTKELARHVRKVIAVEIDSNLLPILRQNLHEIHNVEIVHADALRFQPPEARYHFVANVPYNISSPLLNHFIKDQFSTAAPRPPKTCTLMLQKEVAEKLCAAPPRMNVLALHVQPFGEAALLFQVPRHVFSPQPNVDSAVVRIELFEKPKIFDFAVFFRLVHAGFLQKRKQLWNSLSSAIPESEKRKMVFEAAKIDPQRRAETLSISEWNRLVKALENPVQSILF